jgi:RNA polymerase sigma factor (sigma-70 family)
MSPLALSIRFLQTQPDGRLVELARAGNERAFEALVKRYRRPLLAYCRRLAGSDGGAEDALQQALLQAWIALGSADTEVRDARAWLYRIVHNVLVSNLRRRNHDSVEVDQIAGASGADHEVEQRIAVRQALADLAALPDLQRRVMMSTALEGRSHDEIAVALGLSHGAVRGLIYRARATLRASAAALVPSPLVNWVARLDLSGAGRPIALYEAIAGGGSAGLGGLLLKGGAIVATAGALATAAGITSSSQTHRFHHRSTSASAVRTAPGSAAAGADAARAQAAAVGGAKLTSASGGTRMATRGADRAPARGSSWRSGHTDRGRHGRGGGSQSMTAGGPARGSGSNGGSSPSGSSGSSGRGSDGGRGGGSDGGSRSGSPGAQMSGGGSGGDHGAGHGNQSSGTAGVTGDGGSGGGHGDGGGSGGQNGGSGSGGGSGGSASTPPPATLTTASTSNLTASTPGATVPTSGDGSGGDGSHGGSGHGD